MHSLAPETDVRAIEKIIEKIGDRPRFSVIRCPVKTVVCPPFLFWPTLRPSNATIGSWPVAATASIGPILTKI